MFWAELIRMSQVTGVPLGLTLLDSSRSRLALLRAASALLAKLDAEE